MGTTQCHLTASQNIELALKCMLKIYVSGSASHSGSQNVPRVVQQSSRGIETKDEVAAGDTELSLGVFSRC